MTLVEIAMRLRELAGELGCQELNDLADEMKRRPPVMRARKTSRKVDLALKSTIIALHRAHPGWSQLRIANEVGVNPGRVSETLAGFRS